jgi:hypothetical protein
LNSAHPHSLFARADDDMLRAFVRVFRAGFRVVLCQLIQYVRHYGTEVAMRSIL